MPKNFKIFLTVLFIVIITFLAIKGLSMENDWTCVNGNWVSNGQPTSPMPTILCDK